MIDKQLEELVYEAGLGEIKDILAELGGSTNGNYKVKLSNGETVVCRLAGDTKVHFIDREEEKINDALAVSMGINVKTLYYQLPSGSKISQFVERKSNIDAHDIISVLRKLHSADIPQHKSADIYDLLHKYQDICQNHNIRLDARFDKQFRRINNHANDFRGIKKVLCHRDIIFDNFIKTSKNTFLIDWEYAGIDDPLIDIASLLMNYPRYDRDAILEMYYDGVVPSDAVPRVKILGAALSLLCYLWSEIRLIEPIQNYKPNEITEYGFSRLDYCIEQTL